MNLSRDPEPTCKLTRYKGSQFGFFGSLPALGYEDFTQKKVNKNKTLKCFFPLAGRGGLNGRTSATPRPGLQTAVFLRVLSNENSQSLFTRDDSPREALGTCHVLPPFPNNPHSDLRVFILPFLFSLQSSHRGHHPGWRLPGPQPSPGLRAQRTDRWTCVPSPAECSHTVTHVHTHTGVGSSQQRRPRPGTPSPGRGGVGDTSPR